jgi:hypothetical protein
MKRDDGNYICLETGLSVVTTGSSTNWVIKAGSNIQIAAGTFASEADAQDAIRKLVHGLDPATLV